MSLLQDEDIQRKDIVCIKFNVGKKAIQQEFEMMKQTSLMRMAVPDHVVGVHFCYNDPTLRSYIAGIQLLLLKDERERFRAHFGNEQETIFELQT